MHPALEICDEPFNENFPSWSTGNKNFRELARDWASFETVLDEIFTSFNGLKLLSYQLSEEWVARLIGRPDFRVLFVRRRNVLQAVVSVLIAEQTQLWHRWDTTRSIETYYADLDPLDIEDVRTRLHELGRRDSTHRDGDRTSKGRSHSPTCLRGALLRRTCRARPRDPGCLAVLRTRRHRFRSDRLLPATGAKQAELAGDLPANTERRPH